MKAIILFKTVLFLTFTASLTGYSGANPGSVLIQVGGVWFSQNGDCSSPTNVFSTDTPSAVDFMQSPTLGTNSSLANGTYKCVIVKMKDAITFTTAAATSNCTSTTTQYQRDLCRTGTSTKDLDGVSTNCSGTSGNMSAGGVSNWVYLYISTFTRVNNTGNSFEPPTADQGQEGITLSSAMTISDTPTTWKFVADFTGKVDNEGGSECGLDAPVFSFKQITSSASSFSKSFSVLADMGNFLFSIFR